MQYRELYSYAKTLIILPRGFEIEKELFINTKNRKF